MNRKVLHFFPHPLKQRHGGPYSFLWHLRQGLQGLNHQVYFLSDFLPAAQPSGSNYKTVIPLWKTILKKMVPERWRTTRKINRWLNDLVAYRPSITEVNLNDFDVLHFHETIDVWRYRDWLEIYRGTIVLSSHSPKPYHLELMEDALRLPKNSISEEAFDSVEAIDQFAFERADHIVFPCQQSVNPYYQLWPGFANIVSDKPMHYLATGVVAEEVSEDYQLIRKKLNIPDEAFVLTYIGRKLAVKGYDLLVEAARRLLPEMKGLYFIIVGTASGKAAINDARWIETGWSEAPLSFVMAGNLHVVPNRHTNFDLNVLEVLSIGKPLLISATDGNNYFRQFNSAGLFYHEPETESLCAAIRYCYGLRNELEQWGRHNKTLYRQHFTAQRFATDYIEFYNSL